MPQFTEPWRTTAIRTGTLAVVAGVGAGLYTRQLAVVPITTLLALWFTLGGHMFEVLFLNRVRPNLNGRSTVLVMFRVAYWFVAGVALFQGALLTRTLLIRGSAAPFAWWVAGVGFIGVELLVHLGNRARSRPSLFNGRG
jgi:hypothetical protein